MVSVAVNPSTRGPAHSTRSYGGERVSLVYFRIFRAAGFSEYAEKRGTKVAPGSSCTEARRAHTCTRRTAAVPLSDKLGRIGRRPEVRTGRRHASSATAHGELCGALLILFFFLLQKRC